MQNSDEAEKAIDRRSFLKTATLGTAAFAAGASLLSWARPAEAAGTLASVQLDAAKAAKELANGRGVTLRILEPSGSLGNIKPVAEKWTAETGIKVEYIEVPLGEINQKVLLEAVSKAGSFDLDQLASKYEPEGYQDSIIYKTANYYKGNFYGYETDGDAYVMFYRNDWINDPEEQKRYTDKYGSALKVPDTWEELDQQLAFFHRPETGRYGGTLFRSQYFIAWEWWVRFHAKGFFPFTDDLAPQINNEAGVKALEELAAASKYLYPSARSNGLFENFEAYGKGDSYANIGWGGTQKYLNGDKSGVKGKLTYGPTPGGNVNGKLVRTPYFNWGWNYVVSSLSKEQEIAYLFTLYAISPTLSTIAVRDPGGYFDPFRDEHYKDPEIIKLYSKEFLDVHEASMRGSIPDLYLKGQGEYFDVLRVNVQAADVGQKTPKQALDDTARDWDRISRRIGRKGQTVQWRFLKGLYPQAARTNLV
jgi:multiple sugar transport system substrate-binding protein